MILGPNCTQLEKITTYRADSVQSPTTDLQTVSEALVELSERVATIIGTGLGIKGDTADSALERLKALQIDIDESATAAAQTATARASNASAASVAEGEFDRVLEHEAAYIALAANPPKDPVELIEHEAALEAIKAAAENIAGSALNTLNISSRAAIAELPYQPAPSESGSGGSGGGSKNGTGGSGGGGNGSAATLNTDGGGSGFGGGGYASSSVGTAQSRPLGTSSAAAWTPSAGASSVGSANYASFLEYGSNLAREINEFMGAGGNIAHANFSPIGTVSGIGSGIREIPEFIPRPAGEFSTINFESARPTTMPEFARMQSSPFTGVNLRTNIAPLSPIGASGAGITGTAITSSAGPSMGPNLARLMNVPQAHMGGLAPRGAAGSNVTPRPMQPMSGRPMQALRPSAGRGGASTMGARPAAATPRAGAPMKGGAAGQPRATARAPMTGRPMGAMTPRGAAGAGKAGAVKGSNPKGLGTGTAKSTQGAKGGATGARGATGTRGATGARPVAGRVAPTTAAGKSQNTGTAGTTMGKAGTATGGTAATRGSATKAATSATGARPATAGARPVATSAKGAGANMRSLTGARAAVGGLGARGQAKSGKKAQSELQGLTTEEIVDDSKIRYIEAGERQADA